MTTWYDPLEIQHEADNLQRQPEFAPDHELLGEDWTSEEGAEDVERTTEIVTAVNDIAEIVETVIAPNQ